MSAEDPKTMTEAMIYEKERSRSRSRPADQQWSKHEIERFKSMVLELPRLRLPPTVESSD